MNLGGKGATLYPFRPFDACYQLSLVFRPQEPCVRGPQKDQRMMYLQSSLMSSKRRGPKRYRGTTHQSMRPRPCVREEATSLGVVPAVSKAGTARKASDSHCRSTFPWHRCPARRPMGNLELKGDGHRGLQGPASEMRNAASCRSLAPS